jgi:hypothetical protein
VEGSVDMDMAQARGLARHLPVLQMLNSHRMAELALALRLKRERDGRHYEQGACVPICVVALAPAPKRSRKGVRPTEAVDLPQSAQSTDDPSTVCVWDALWPDEGSFCLTQGDDGQDLTSLMTYDAMERGEDDGSDPDPDLEPGVPREADDDDSETDPDPRDRVMSDDAILEMLFRVIAGPSGCSEDEWMHAVLEQDDAPVTGLTKLHLALAYTKHHAACAGGLAVDDLLISNDLDGTLCASFDPEPDLSLFGAEFWGHYQAARLRRIAAMATEPAGVRDWSRRAAADEWVTLKRLSLGRELRHRDDVLVMLEDQADRLFAAGYFG